MITVGDQIFTLTKQVEALEKQCHHFQEALRAIIALQPCEQQPQHNCPTCLAREALVKPNC
jgi:hypothetical protein